MSAQRGFRVSYYKQCHSERFQAASWNRRERAGLGCTPEVGSPGRAGAPGVGTGARFPSGKAAPVYGEGPVLTGARWAQGRGVRFIPTPFTGWQRWRCPATRPRQQQDPTLCGPSARLTDPGSEDSGWWAVSSFRLSAEPG